MALTFTPSMDPWIWVAAFLSIAMISYAFKESHLWYICESTIIGVGTAHEFVTSVSNIITKGITPISNGKILLVLPIILGLLIFCRLTDNYRWVSRYPLGILLGVGVGLNVSAGIYAQILNQINATILPLFVAGDSLTTLNNWITAIIVVCGILYFVFTFRQVDKAPLSWFARVGRLGMMACFGVFFGMTVLSRLTSLYDPVKFVLHNWLGLIPVA